MFILMNSVNLHQAKCARINMSGSGRESRMNLLNKLVILLLLTGVYTPSFAAVGELEMTSCSSVLSEGEEKEEGKEGDEEPDCE